MSYEMDDEGNKVFYEPELLDEEREAANPMNFDDWYDIYCDDLMEEYIKDNPEEFPTKDMMADIENMCEYQSYTESEYEKYIERLQK